MILDRAEEAVTGEEEMLEAFVGWANETFPVGIRRSDLASAATASDAEAVAEAVFDRVRKAYELKIATENQEHLEPLERMIILQSVDTHWQEYLRNMDALRQGVGLRAYGQRDPLVEYKKEAYDMFEDLMDRIKLDIAGRVFRTSTSVEAMQNFLSSIPRGRLVHENVSAMDQQREAAPEPVPAGAGAGRAAPRGAEEGMRAALQSTAAPVRRDDNKVGRNDPCPCGSGKKFKKCCGAG